MRDIKSYNYLITLPTFKERFDYLELNGKVGESTFGFDRFLNQQFYKSREWRQVRDEVITRDMGCDLACTFDPFQYEIHGMIVIHHINPLTIEDVRDHTDFLLDPNYLVCVSDLTHRALHLGDRNILPRQYIPRAPNDTCPWRQ